MKNLHKLYFEEKEKFFAKQSNNSFEFIKGSIANVLISAPHAVNQIREGNVKLADIHTGPLAYALNRLGYSCLVKTKTCNDDANYDLKSDYKDYIFDYVKNNDTLFVVDLHGMSKKRDINICLGTNYENYNDEFYITNHFSKIALDNGIEKVRFDFPFSSSSGRTITSFVSENCKICCLQIEINSRIFEDKKQIHNLINTLNQFIFEITSYLRTSRHIVQLDHQRYNTYDQAFLNNTYSENPISETINHLPILASSPDACSMLDDGVTIKSCETLTGAMVVMLGEDKICDSIFKSCNTNYNSNKDYAHKAIQLIQQNKYKAYIEIHTMNSLRKQDIVICCNGGRTIQGHLEIISQIFSNFRNIGINNISIDYPFNMHTKDKIIVDVEKKTKIPCLQIIINQRVLDEYADKIYIAIQRIISMLD